MRSVMDVKALLLIFCLVNSHSANRHNANNDTPKLLERLKNELSDVSWSIFEAKHLLNNGHNKDENGKPIIPDSFQELTKDGDTLKQYLIYLNCKLKRGGILPGTGSHFDAWFKSLEKNALTIIDADIDSLEKSVQTEFKKHNKSLTIAIDKLVRRSDKPMDHSDLEDEVQSNAEFWLETKLGTGKDLTDVPKLYQDYFEEIPNWSPTFQTRKSFTVTEIQYKVTGRDDKGKMTMLTISLEQKSLLLNFTTTVDGKPRKLYTATVSSFHSSRKLIEAARFSRKELQDNSELAAKVWKKAKPGTYVLNDEIEAFREILDILHQNSLTYDGNKNENAEKSNSSINLPGCTDQPHLGPFNEAEACGFKFLANREIESINPKKFLDAYNKATTKDRTKLAEAARNHMDKIVTSNDENDLFSKTMLNKLQLEQTASHIVVVKAAECINDITKTSLEYPQNTNPVTPAQILKDVEMVIKPIDSKVKLSASMIAKALSAAVLSTTGNNFSSIQVSNSFGSRFLTKTLINGISQNDTTSLAIVGGHLGQEIATKTGTMQELSSFAEVGKGMSRQTKSLGTVAGALATGLDIGLSISSLANSVQRLINSSNKYDKNDAIAAIVSDSIGIVITASVTALSYVFPPFAPVFGLIGAILGVVNQLALSLFKSHNEVNRINSKIPLLGFEKKNLFKDHFFNWFGKRQPDYIDSLLEEKQANDLVVQHNLKFLEQNLNFVGIVFPSRTLMYEGSCRLTNQHCALKRVGGCTRWEGETWGLTGCDWRKPCGPRKEICDTYRDNVKTWSYDQKRCHCDQKAKTEFGLPRSNSIVDLRQRRDIYWERSVPSDVENAAFLCKPGSQSYIDYKVSKENPTSGEYLCENAIGLLQPYYKRKAGQMLLFDLQDGNDVVRGSYHSTDPYLFRMGNDGSKEFYGGKARNEFVFDSYCNRRLTGNFFGGIHDDSIRIESQCANRERITVNFQNGQIVSSLKSLQMRFSSVEEVIGRENKGESFLAACSTRKIIGRGGSLLLSDEINIPSNLLCNYNITVLLGNNTNLKSLASRGNISLPISSVWNLSRVDVNVYPKSQQSLDIIFLETRSSDITKGAVKTHDWGIEALIDDKNQSILLQFRLFGNESEVKIVFNEDSKHALFSTMILRPEHNAFFYHLLSKNDRLSRIGCKSIENVFEIKGTDWTVIGGDKSDHFIVHNDNFKQIDGGAGMDTLTLRNNLSSHHFVDLSNTSTRFKNIESVFGIPGVPLALITSCSTKIVASGGGSNISYDEILVPMQRCSTQRNTQIICVGKTKVLLYPGNNETEQKLENEQVLVYINTTNNVSTDFFLSMNSSTEMYPGLLLVLNTNHYNWEIKNFTQTEHENITLQIGTYNETKGTINIGMKRGPTENYALPPPMQVLFPDSQPGLLEFTADAFGAKLLFQESKNTSTYEPVFIGFLNLENEFFVTASITSWEVLGGNLNDVMFVKTTNQNPRDLGTYTADGGAGTDNILVLTAAKNETDNCFEVNLADTYLGYVACNSSRLRYQQGSVKNIHHVLGRISAKDILVSTCNTKTMDGRSGKGPGDGLDQLFIADANCSYNLAVVMGQHTAVNNLAKTGRFMYNMKDLTTSSIKLHPSSENHHEISFQLNSWELIHNIAFDRSSKALGFRIEEENRVIIHGFPLYIPPNSTVYTNPVFNFGLSGSNVNANVEVTRAGVTLVTYVVESLNETELVKGLPVDVNRFLINITSGESGKLEGCADGNRCSANQFWVFDLKRPLESVDGGKCTNLGCTNSLNFAKSFGKHSALVNLDEKFGFVKLEDKEILIAHLRNIHQFHGTGTESVYVGCNTTQLTSVKNVIIPSRIECFPDLVVEVNQNTKVIFKEPNFVPEENLAISSYGSIHYRFTEAMSFDPDGDILDLSFFDHIYYLPFSLNSMQNLKFVKGNNTLTYILNETEYNFHMFSDPEITEQFYTQPSILTNDGYNLQVARDGSIWATLGNTSTDIIINSVSELQAVASKLGITMVIRSSTEFYHIGHSNSLDDRNVLGNMLASTSHLAGGGANKTIYEISYLERDVFIHTGFMDDGDDESVITGGTQQTVDLTDVVAPLRAKLGTKYVPSLRATGESIEIVFEDHTDQFPGKVILVDGVYSWVRRRIQLLLNNAMMEIALLPNHERKSGSILSNNSKAGIRNNQYWKIIPRVVKIPEAVAVFSVSMEDLEDNQIIQMETKATNSRDKTRALVSSEMDFKAAQNNTDLFLTNALSSGFQELQTILLVDFFRNETSSFSNKTKGKEGVLQSSKSQHKANTLEIIKLPRAARNISFNLPGLSLVLNDTTLMTENDEGNLVPVQILELKHEFDMKEHQLNPSDASPGKKSKTTTIVFLVSGCLSAVALVAFLVWIIYVLRKNNQIPDRLHSSGLKQIQDSDEVASGRSIFGNLEGMLTKNSTVKN